MTKRSSGARFVDRGCLSKRRYGTREKAEKAVLKAKEKYGDDRIVYHCPLCSGYHLSSKDSD
jgi:hypothetical protein